MSDPLGLIDLITDNYHGIVYFDDKQHFSIPRAASKDKDLIIEALKREIKLHCEQTGENPNDERWEIRIK